LQPRQRWHADTTPRALARSPHDLKKALFESLDCITHAKLTEKEKNQSVAMVMVEYLKVAPCGVFDPHEMMEVLALAGPMVTSSL